MKLAILLPEQSDQGWLWRARALAHALRAAAWDNFEVVVGLPRNLPDRDYVAAHLQKDAPWLSVRALDWRPTPADQFHRVYPSAQQIDFVDRYSVPQDGGWNYADCDAWIVFGDERMGAPAPLRPTAVYCRDLSSRYVAGQFGDIHTDPFWALQVDAFLAWRKSCCVFAVEDHTILDAVGYAGVARAKVQQVPSLWGWRRTVQSSLPPRFKPGYIAWLIEPLAVYDALNAIAALNDYVGRGGSKTIVLIGEEVSEFDPRKGRSNAFRRALATAPELLAKMEFAPVRAPAFSDALVQDCDIVWCSAIADGEPDAPRLAAQYGKCLLAPDYPQMRASAAYLERGIFYDPTQPEALTSALFEAEHAAAFSDGAANLISPSPEAATAYAAILRSVASNAG